MQSMTNTQYVDDILTRERQSLRIDEHCSDVQQFAIEMYILMNDSKKRLMIRFNDVVCN